MEDFITIPDFPCYSINKEGQVFSQKCKRLLQTSVGYRMVRFHENGKQHTFLIHRLLAYIYLNLPSLESDLEVDHIDRNPLNNELSNLQVLSKQHHHEKTASENKWYCHTAYFCSCGRKLWEHNISGLCKICKNDKLTQEITLEKIIYWVTNFSWVRAGKELGLSDNGVRKRFTKLSGLKPSEIHSCRAGLVKAPRC